MARGSKPGQRGGRAAIFCSSCSIRTGRGEVRGAGLGGSSRSHPPPVLPPSPPTTPPRGEGRDGEVRGNGFAARKREGCRKQELPTLDDLSPKDPSPLGGVVGGD